MPRVIESPVKHYPGSVTIPDYMTYPQLGAWEEAMAAVGEHKENAIKALPPVWAAAREIVTEWKLEGVDPARPPATPRAAAIELAAWLINAINGLFDEEDIDPKA